jgi:hypothetical protein
MREILTYRHLSFWLLITIVAAGCANVQSPVQLGGASDPAIQSCRAKFKLVDSVVASVADAETSRIPGFPYLRVNRLHAAYAKNSMPRPAFKAWVHQLRSLARAARTVEIANLPKAKKASLTVSPAQLENCAEILQKNDLLTDQGRKILQENSHVPDHYSNLSRIVGIYPLSSVPIWLGYKNLRKSQKEDFRLGLHQPNKTTYGPAISHYPAKVQNIMRMIERDALGLPILSASDRHTILSAFAPIFTIEHVTKDDAIGMPRYNANGALGIDINDPVVFHRITFTRIGGEAHIQLVYTTFFPARTSSGPLDLFAGQLDGLIWRVTLDKTGRPIIYDSAHPCGCYHLFFPATPWRIKPSVADATFGEPPLAPIAGPIPKRGERVRLLVKAGTHYLAGVKLSREANSAQQTPYRMTSENVLRSLPTSGGSRRSLYDTDGIVVQSVRPERFLLWPMGIANAGAMRQWGTHATAFIGRRHFDDPFLFDGMLTQE